MDAAKSPLDEGDAEVDAPPSAGPSVDVIYSEVTGRLSAQDAQIATLDSKANFGLGSATLLTAGVTGLATAVDEAREPSQDRSMAAERVATADLWWFGEHNAERLTDYITLASLGVYVLVIVFSFLAYNLRQWRVTPQPAPFFDEALSWPAESTKVQLAVQRIEDFEFNEKKIKAKVRWVRFAMLALLFEAILLLAVTVVQVRM